MVINGFEIEESNGVGKSGNTPSKMQTIQVREPFGEGYLLRKQFRYKVGDTNSKIRAMVKATDFAREAEPTKLSTK